MGRNSKYTFEDKVKAVEDYLNGKRSVSEIMEDLSVKSSRSIRNWIEHYRQHGKEALLPVEKNQSYSSELKNRIVSEYLNGEGSVTELCAKYKIKGHRTLQHWISLYNSHIELRDYNPKSEVYMATARRKTTISERKEIVDHCIKNHRNYKETADKYDVSYSQVYNWVKKYDLDGDDGLLDKRGRHKTDDEVDALERLRRENARLKRQLEEKDRVAELLKKVKEFERM